MKNNHETRLEYILMHAYKEDMIKYLKSTESDFEQAINLAIADKQPYSWRAAWLLYSCMHQNDSRVLPYTDHIISCLPHKKDGHQRELLKVLSQMQISEEQQGLLYAHCARIWEKNSGSPSVRYTALMTMVDIARNYPDLMQEIILYGQEPYIDTLSPGIKQALIQKINDLKTQYR